MTSVGIAPFAVLIFGGAAALLIICLVQLGRRRRGGRMFAACMILLMVLGGFAMLLPVTMRSRAESIHSHQVAARAQAERSRFEALNQTRISSPLSSQLPIPPQLPNQPIDPEDAGEDAAVAPDEATSYVESKLKIESTTAEIGPDGTMVVQSPSGLHVEANRTTKPKPKPTVVTTRTRTRHGGSQVVPSILLAGLVFAGYFFLNANTRGHYTWQLRFGSTLVFVAALALIFAVGRHF